MARPFHWLSEAEYDEALGAERQQHAELKEARAIIIAYRATHAPLCRCRPCEAAQAWLERTEPKELADDPPF